MTKRLMALTLLSALAVGGMAQPLTTTPPVPPPSSMIPTAGPATTPVPPTAPAQPTQKKAPSPVQTLRLAVETLRTFLRQEPPPSGPAIARFLDTKIAPLFDFQAMARQAGGRWYAKLDPQRKAAMAEEMKRLFLTRLTEALLLYRNQEVRFLRPRIATDGSEADVTMLIVDPRRYPARIDFRVALDGPRWRIIDIAANGSRATVYYRRLLAREMARRAWYRQQAARPATAPSATRSAPMGGMSGMPPAAPGRPFAPWR
ncbi:MAG: ABC transporter substrate-binding protein [Gammaproteobacteria bacterium]|nr:MAG: ABC transporter substrate-binding protein [Gammaproteobacteria bacterium]